MQILGLLGMHFDAVVVKVKQNLLLFRLVLAILSLHTAEAIRFKKLTPKPKFASSY